MDHPIHSKRDLPFDAPVPRPEARGWTVWPEDPAELRLTANAGVLLEWRGEKLLLDGLHDSRAHDFSPVSRPVLDALEGGAPPWDGIRWVFYTHLHIDHFSGRETVRFLERQRPDRLFLPAGNGGPGMDGEDIAALRHVLTERAIPTQELRLEEFQTVCFPLAPGLRATAFRSAHAGAGNEDVMHICWLFELGERTVLFLGDSDFDGDYFAAVLAGRRIDVLVVDPLFVTNPAGRAVVGESIRPGRLVVDHIPFQQDDKLHMRRLVVRVLDRWGGKLPPTALLWDEGDTVLL